MLADQGARPSACQFSAVETTGSDQRTGRLGWGPVEGSAHHVRRDSSERLTGCGYASLSGRPPLHRLHGMSARLVGVLLRQPSRRRVSATHRRQPPYIVCKHLMTTRHGRNRARVGWPIHIAAKDLRCPRRLSSSQIRSKLRPVPRPNNVKPLRSGIVT